MDDQTTSLSLLQRARLRDNEAWRRLHYLYAPAVARWLKSWGVQGADADDLAQDVFQAVHRGLKSFRRDRGGDSFRGWLYTIARRKFFDLKRRNLKEPAADGGTTAHVRMAQVPADVPADAPDDVTERHHRALELIRDDFEDRTWHAFWYSAVQGRSADDVGKDLGMSAVSVRKAKSRVLRRLKEEFRELLK